MTVEGGKVVLEAALLLAELDDGGFDLRVADGKVQVSPASKLTAAQREMIGKWRDDLVTLVGDRGALDREVLARPPPLARVAFVGPALTLRASSGGRGRRAGGGGR